LVFSSESSKGHVILQVFIRWSGGK